MKKKTDCIDKWNRYGWRTDRIFYKCPKRTFTGVGKRKLCVFLNGGDMEDVPLWYEVLEKEGYVFSYEDSHSNISVYGTSAEWLEEKYPDITEQYVIEDQPEL